MKKPEKKPLPKAVSVRFRPDKMRALQAYADRKGTTVSAVVQTAVSEKLERESK